METNGLVENRLGFRALRVGLGLLAIGGTILATRVLLSPTPQLEQDRVSGLVVGPADATLPFGEPAAFAWVRVVAFPNAVPTRLAEVAVGRQPLVVDTYQGRVMVAPPLPERWHDSPGLSWNSEVSMRHADSLQGLPVVSGWAGRREALTSLGYTVVIRRLDPGDHVIIEHPNSKTAVLWRGTERSWGSGNRLATTVATVSFAGLGMLCAMGLWLMRRPPKGHWASFASCSAPLPRTS